MSRGVAGQVGRTFLVNLPGSRGGVKDGMAVLDPLIDHISAQLEDVHGHGEDRSVTRSGDAVLPAAEGDSHPAGADAPVAAGTTVACGSGPAHDAARAAVPDAAASSPGGDPRCGPAAEAPVLRARTAVRCARCSRAPRAGCAARRPWTPWRSRAPTRWPRPAPS